MGWETKKRSSSKQRSVAGVLFDAEPACTPERAHLCGHGAAGLGAQHGCELLAAGPGPSLGQARKSDARCVPELLPGVGLPSMHKGLEATICLHHACRIMTMS